ncbi:NAD(P)-binding oxidoreductase [Shewanella violacea]|uniref:NAD(P)-binding domain-containing protein n=1 Tax=Shewanella violacea (strain JCM 10179 / CIP 106290 / LMG 19151 / DSS12) TaxID=637905 RepID=D4ZJS5_SHEVD|nr:NAD(P)-binding oxidoreductase [Shewanella violacea]BAJ01924.1 conserved hypothetical protein [Shewanella violacea DSS12]
MNTLVIWGAASGLGAAMLEYFYHQDINVIAVVRDPNKNPRLAQLGITRLTCDALDNKQVQESLAAIPTDAWVISTMGSFQTDTPVDYIGHRHLINALENNNIRRFLLITSLGCGDSWQYLSDRAKLVFGASLREKSLAESWLKTSRLNYTILRPGGLKDGGITESGNLSQNTEIHGLIHRSEVARLTHQLLQDEASIGQIYQCVDPSLT